ncbi:MAG: ATP-binding cassette domain-containing protein [Pseudomonadota bacterium]
MALIRMDDIRVAFGDHAVLSDASLAIKADERVCIIGRNGAGKSTTLKLLSNELLPESGDIVRQADLRIGQLSQSLPAATHISVREFVGAALESLKVLRDDYQQRSAALPAGTDPTEPEALAVARLQSQVEAQGAWTLEQRIERTISDLDLPADLPMSSLSGGWRRRVALARVLVTDPELLLLDEPTNHLDLDTIEWLEQRLLNFSGSIVFITHDRAFLRNIATRIVDIDRGKLVSWPGNFDDYLSARALAWAEEDDQNARFDKRLAEEEAWIRQGIKARRTRNEGRVRALEAMREEHGQRQKRAQAARVHIESAEQSGRKVIQLHNVHFGYTATPLIEGLSLTVQRGERIGLVGNNGVGKSTLLRLMLGELTPQRGTVKLGTNIQMGYFDQLRRELDDTKTIAEVVGDGSDYVYLNGKPRHVVGYLRGFLFSPKRILSPIAALSGGERNRVVLAKLFTQPANLLVLDEPTNDLDVETLQVLEAQLQAYNGTLIVVSHDREFLDNVVTSTLVFEAGGRIERYVGNYSDWLARRRQLATEKTPQAKNATSSSGRSAAPKTATKLGYQEQRELDGLPDAIEALEATLSAQRQIIAAEGFYDQDFDSVVAPALAELEAQERQLDTLTTRWLMLEDKAERLRKGRSVSD